MRFSVSLVIAQPVRIAAAVAPRHAVVGACPRIQGTLAGLSQEVKAS